MQASSVTARFDSEGTLDDVPVQLEAAEITSTNIKTSTLPPVRSPQSSRTTYARPGFGKIGNYTKTTITTGTGGENSRGTGDVPRVESFSSPSANTSSSSSPFPGEHTLITSC